MRREARTSGVEYRLYLDEPQNGLRVVFYVDAVSPREAHATISGLFSGTLSDLPVLYKDSRTLLTTIVAGGLGTYVDNNPWFGEPLLFNRFNPLAGELPRNRTSWSEASLELGIGGATQLGDSTFYAFGAVTGMRSWSIGQDIFTADERAFDDIKKAYVGLLYADRHTKNRAKLSLGRQTVTLNDGFLVNLVKGSSNAGERGATYLGPRLANDFSVLADGGFGPIGFHVFYIDPNELEALESDSTFLGANAKYTFNEDVSLDTTFITLPTSKSTYANPHGLTLRREGLDTVSAHLMWRNLLGAEGLWFEGEIAHQFHPDYDMSANAFYGTLGYIARDVAWTPSLSYRYSQFSGDDPDTKRYERYDPLMNTGLGIWLQGVSFGKLTSNSNLEAHRVQLNVSPVEALNLTLDWHLLRAPELNNLGSNPALGTLTSHQLGHEFTLSARWALNRNLYLQSLISYAIPGEALRDVGADKNWMTAQVSLYWGL